jgi:hypothetical protein
VNIKPIDVKALIPETQKLSKIYQNENEKAKIQSRMIFIEKDITTHKSFNKVNNTNKAEKNKVDNSDNNRNNRYMDNKKSNENEFNEKTDKKEEIEEFKNDILGKNIDIRI